jgi:diguanylate cyclase (GGDEF)-like protein
MKISPSVRVSFGLVMFTLSVILIADSLGMVPKKDMMILDFRKKVCESLAVQLSVAASHSEFEIVKMTLEAFVERNEDVVAASMRKVDGPSIAKFGDFVEGEDNDFDAVESKSTDNVVTVPIFAAAEQWGSVKVEFKSIYDVGLFTFLTDSILGILLFVAFGTFTGFLFILRKALKVLDPKSVVPDRVRTAFNTLSEGVMIIDDKEQIIMANNAFAEKVNKNADDLLGVNASSLKWKYINKEQRNADSKMPWASTIKKSVKNINVALKLSTREFGVRSLSANCAPILDDAGKTRGALVTFDDVTDMQENNVLLENAVDRLQKNESEIKRKNSELEVLATRDSLTGCYNRRAFFDLFESAYSESEKTKKPLTCIMLDIDHFKSINDRFGHTIGDEVIRLIADVLNHHCEYENAIVGRYGGEEFCIALPAADMNIAADVAERLRRIIQLTSKDFFKEKVTVTASFGLSCKSDAVSNCSQILEQADKALYGAKESGRNKVIRWQQDNIVASVNEAVVIDINDKSDKKLKDSHPAKEDKGKISLLESEVEALQNKLRELEKSDGLDDTATVDVITKLPSKTVFMDRVNQAISYSERNKKLLAVVTLNIDMFSRINDTMGKAIGDSFLLAVGHRLKTILRRSDTVASLLSGGQAGPSFSRLRDDEFALLLTGLDDIESLSYVIKRIQTKFAGKIEVSGNEIYVTTSIGVAMFPQDGKDSETLVINSRRAQKLAKTQTGRNNYQLYSVLDNSKIRDQMQIEIDLHNAIEEQQFVLLYQPKLEIASGNIVGIEALIRWQHPTKGMVFPDAFIPAAEKTGMILDMGKWCLLEACKQTKQWVDMGATNIRTSVNVSAVEFADTDFLDNVFNSIKISGINACNLEIEITESTIMADQEEACRLIEELRFHGVTITLDDFGSGYSSLSCFGNLKLDWLKLDRGFLLEAMKNTRSKTIYSSIVKMVHATGVKVVSEGVETQEEYAYIKELEVDELQGYLISKPVDVKAVELILFPDAVKQMKTIT